MIETTTESKRPKWAGVDDRPPCATAEAFLADLRPTREIWMPDPTAWIFRGHGDAEWELKAIAVRRPESFKEFGIPGDASTWSPRVDVVKRLLTTFREGLDQAGIVVPAPSPIVDWDDHPRSSTLAEPAFSSFPLMALAQHHGLPTMFLDWTKRGLVAAYFAAIQALTSSDVKSPLMAVWALHGSRGLKGPPLQRYQAPGGTNPNLRAQSGVFTILTTESDLGLNEYIAEHGELPLSLRRLTVSRAEAGRLLRLLANEGVDGASMFPGADGVVRAMRERELWDRPGKMGAKST